MYIESQSSFVRLNVAQEVMRFAVAKQAEFVETMARQAEEARKDAARKAAADEAFKVDIGNKEQGDQAGESTTAEQKQPEPQKVASGLGIAVDIQV